MNTELQTYLQEYSKKHPIPAEDQKKLDEMEKENTKRIMESEVYKRHLNNGFMKTCPQRFLSEFDLFYFIVVCNKGNVLNIPLSPSLKTYHLAQSCLKEIKKHVPNAGITMVHCHFSREDENCPRRTEILDEILDEHAIISWEVNEAKELEVTTLTHKKSPCPSKAQASYQSTTVEMTEGKSK